LLRRWRWVFVIYLIFGAIHVLGFSVQAPFIAFLNLVLMLLVASALRFYFPKRGPQTTNSHRVPATPDQPSAEESSREIC
jgi:hypothetical protein